MIVVRLVILIPLVTCVNSVEIIWFSWHLSCHQYNSESRLTSALESVVVNAGVCATVETSPPRDAARYEDPHPIYIRCFFPFSKKI